MRAFGEVDQIKEECRDMRGVNFTESLLQDARYGMRQLGRSPGLTVVVVLSLALGIGANTAIFSLINAVMLKMLPVRNPQQLVLLGWAAHHWPKMVNEISGSIFQDKTGRTVSTSFSYPLFEQFRARNTVFSSLFGFASLGRVNASVDGQAANVEGEMGTGNYFYGLGVTPIFGRVITDDDDKPSAPSVAVISYGYWQRRYGSGGSVVGKSITLNRVPFTIVGVAPAEFFGVEPGRAPDIWVPIRTWPGTKPERFTRSDIWWLVMMGRLKPGVAEQAACAELDGLLKQSLTAEFNLLPKPGHSPNVELSPASKGLDSLRREFSRPLLILMAVVGLVLLIACANVASLLLARATARQREITVRLALGAGRARLVRQLLTESVLLAVVGGVCGLLFAIWGTHALLVFLSSSWNEITLNASVDLQVLGFTAAISLLTGILFGLAPALRSTRVDLASSLKEGPRIIAARYSWLRLGKVLLVAQVAMSLVLLIAAGLFIRTLGNLKNESLGFNRSNLLLFGVDPIQIGYKDKQLANLYGRLLERIQGLPGVRGATFSEYALIGGGNAAEGILVDGYTPRPEEGSPIAWRLIVGPRFAETMEMKLLLGRDIGPQDAENAPKVAMVNETMAHRFFGNSNPIGRRFGIGGPTGPKAYDFEVVGMVQDAKYYDLRGKTPPIMYLPFRQMLPALGETYFEVRTAGDPKELVATIRRVVAELDKNLPLFGVRSQREQIDRALFQERLFARLSSFFGLLALGLASVGLYGLMAYTVARRTTEIGVRMALGAERGRVCRMMLQESLVLVAAGILIGLPAALAATRLVSSMLFGLTPSDPATITMATFVMLTVATFASYLPARRASHVDPMVALRYE